MLRVKEIACDNVVSQSWSSVWKSFVWHSCGGRAQGRKTRTSHVGKPFQSCGLHMNCARRFPYIVRGSCFSCRLCLASIDLGLPKPSFEASRMRHKMICSQDANHTAWRKHAYPRLRPCLRSAECKKPMKWYAFYRPSWSSMDLYGTESTTRSWPSKNPVCVPCEPVHRCARRLGGITGFWWVNSWKSFCHH